MKSQIQRVLEMNKSGALTDDQTAELIEALTRAGAPADAPIMPPKFKGFGATLRESIAGPIRDATHAPWRSSDLRGVYASDLRENDTQMSKVELVESHDYAFQGNGIRMSSVRLELKRGAFTGNAVSASRVEGVVVRDGALRDSEVQGSAVESVEVADSEVLGLHVTASQVTQVRVVGHSVVQQLKITGTEFKGLNVHNGASCADVRISSTQASHVELDASTLRDVEIDAAHCLRVQLLGSQLTASVLRGARLTDVVLQGSRLDNVLVTGGDGWRRRGLHTVRFENCQLEQVLLADCRWKGVTIRNVQLRGVQVNRVDLSDVVIDGNTAFLQAISANG